MKRALLIRRTEVFKRMVKGFSIEAVAKDLIKNNPLYQNLSVSAIVTDWTRRKNWLHLIIRSDDQTILNETLGSVREVAHAGWKIYADSLYEDKKKKNFKAQVGALRIVLEANAKLLDILQNIGVIDRVPTETRVTLATTPFEADPEMKRLLLEEAAKQRKEKDAAKQV
jgi:hypothetical protein